MQDKKIPQDQEFIESGYKRTQQNPTLISILKIAAKVIATSVDFI